MKSANQKFCYLLIFTTLLCQLAFSQEKNFVASENKLASLYSKILFHLPGDGDSVIFYSERFEKEFSSLIATNPGTLTYTFKKLIDSNFCYIKTSADGNFRIYSWDRGTGGTMHFFRKIFQWKANGRVFTKLFDPSEDDPGTFCSAIFTVNVLGKPNYLSVSNGIFSTKDLSQSISAYRIDGNNLTDTVALFKTKTKKLQQINVSFDFFSVVDRPERPVELIRYDSKKKIIYIPVVNENGQVTKKNILYQLKDRYFEFIRIE